ncbi:lipopolysaccharide biosynthesis protein [Halomonas sp. 86]|uniref:lipopolysaccharide biosynthesis protein n=1 Tax=unclassified Halomonas TaxID=2609666 RepID=UPI004033D845
MKPKFYEPPSLEDMNLVDMVVLLLKQWKLMLLFISLFFVTIALLAFLKPAKYDFVTIYSLASYETMDGARHGLEAQEEVVAKVNNVFVEQERRKLLSSGKVKNFPINVAATSLNETLLVKISSRATEEDQPVVELLHKGVAKAISSEQKKLVETLKEKLDRQYELYSQAFDSVRSSNNENAGPLRAFYMERMLQLESRMVSLNQGRPTGIAIQGLEPAGMGKRFILAIGLFLALLLAPLVAMCSVFVTQVIVAYRHKGK